MTKNKASDLHLKPGMRPSFRIATVLHDVGNRPLKLDEVKRMIYEILTEQQIEQFERELDLTSRTAFPATGATASTVSTTAASRRWRCGA